VSTGTAFSRQRPSPALASVERAGLPRCTRRRCPRGGQSRLHIPRPRAQHGASALRHPPFGGWASPAEIPHSGVPRNQRLPYRRTQMAPRQGAVGEMAMSGWVNRVGPLAHRGRAVVSGPSPAGAAAGRPEFEACVEQHDRSRYRTGIAVDLTPVLDPPWDRRDRSRPSRWLRRSDWPDCRFVAVVGGAAGRAAGDRGRRSPSRRTPVTGARAATRPVRTVA
jgi:hypothetical protein